MADPSQRLWKRIWRNIRLIKSNLAAPTATPHSASPNSPPSPTDPPIAGIGSVYSFDETVVAPGPGPVRWRLRILTDNPAVAATPWLSQEGNGELETDLVLTSMGP